MTRTLAIAMLFGRFFLIIPTLALATVRERPIPAVRCCGKQPFDQPRRRHRRAVRLGEWVGGTRMQFTRASSHIARVIGPMQHRLPLFPPAR